MVHDEDKLVLDQRSDSCIASGLSLELGARVWITRCMHYCRVVAEHQATAELGVLAEPYLCWL